jgi:hypothetical protein
MTEREEAEEAARAEGRKIASYDVVKVLTRNGRAYNPGARVRFSKADADILIGAGCIVPARGKPKGEVVEEDESGAPGPEAGE